MISVQGPAISKTAPVGSIYKGDARGGLEGAITPVIAC